MGKSNTYFPPLALGYTSIECQLLCLQKDKNKAPYMIDDVQLLLPGRLLYLPGFNRVNRVHTYNIHVVFYIRNQVSELNNGL